MRYLLLFLLAACSNASAPEDVQRIELVIVDRHAGTETRGWYKCSIAGNVYRCTPELFIP